MKHGKYTSTFYDLKDEWHPEGIWTGCPGCDEEKRKWRDEEEKARERRERIAALRSRASIPARFTNKSLESFQTENKEQQQTLSVARDYVANFDRYRREGRCLVLCGKVGTGKTHLACAVLQAVVQQERRVRYATVMEIIRSIRETWRLSSGQKDETEVLREWIGLDLVVIDEVGVQYGSEAERTNLFDVIDGRYRAMRPTIIITNVDIKGLIQYLGERAFDRLQENGGRILLFTGESWRGRVAQDLSAHTAEGAVQ